MHFTDNYNTKSMARILVVTKGEISTAQENYSNQFYHRIYMNVVA